MRHRKALILWGWQKWLAVSALEMHWDQEKAKEVFFFLDYGWLPKRFLFSWNYGWWLAA